MYDSGEIRKPKEFPEIEEKPYELPKAWVWTRLGIIGDWGAGATPKRSNPEYYGGYLPWLKTGELNDGFISSSEEAVTEKGFENSSLRLCKPGDVLIAMYGATIGKLGILEIEATTNQACCACTPFANFDKMFLFYYLLSLRDNFRSQGAGGAQPNISKTKIEHTLLGLPPIEEQHRIVQKIETLFTQVEELEQKVEQDREAEERLQAAVLDDLQQAETPEASRQSWQRITDSFEQIYRKPEHIDQLKQAILNEAIRGRLVPQDPEDEPAAQLLERIKAEKQRLYEEGEIRKPKVLPEIEKDEISYELPKQWCWTRIGTPCSISGGKRVPKGYTLQDEVTPFIYIRVTDMKRGTIVDNGLKYISEKVRSKISKYTISNEDLYITIAGTIGDVGSVPNRYDGMNLTENAAKIQFYLLDKSYLKQVLNSSVVQNQFFEKVNKMAQPKLALKRIRSTIFPLPPLEEQKRIVQKIEELFSWCDNLKKQLNNSRQTDERLLEALVSGERPTLNPALF